MVQIGDLTLSKELKEKLIGSDREGLGLGIGLGLGSDRRSEPNTVQCIPNTDTMRTKCLHT